jgi:propanol-preferring alcohol dehydrogenase
MKAWQFSGTHLPLALLDRPQPVPGPGEVVLATKACGICHTDVAFFEEEKFTEPMHLPVVLGHEIAGEIVALGDAVTDFSVGDRVAIWPLGEYHGGRRDGGFAAFVGARAVDLVPIPDNVSYEHAAFCDPASTSYAAVEKGEVGPGQKVGIIGFGGLGEMGVRRTVLKGATVFVAEIKEARWERAREAGASRVVKDITEFAGEDLDVVLDFAGYGTTTDGAIAVVRPQGRIVQVGWGLAKATLDIHDLIYKELSLIGSHGGDKSDMAAFLSDVSAGEIVPTFESIGFDGIPEGIGRLRDGLVQGRLVVVY